MAELWFGLVALLFTGWAVLDGFDLGVGVLHRWVAKTDEERREVLGAIGPVWDGNEVWLIAAGGSLFLAFPRALAASLSGFYLPVMFVLWALLLRGLSIHLRSHLGSPLWRSFFDSTFMLGSAAVAVLMGAALGNLVRGVPLREDGYFELPLWTNFATSGELGALDWFTVLCALLATVTVTAHGANWLVLKTAGAVQQRALWARKRLWGVTAALTLLVTFLVPLVNEAALGARVLPGALLALSGLVVIAVRSNSERPAFLGGSAFIVGLLLMTFSAMFPVILRSRGAGASIDVTSAAAGQTSLQAGLVWWGPGILLAAGYFWWVMRHFRGKASPAEH